MFGLDALCAGKAVHYALDGVVLLFFFIAVAVSARKGFIKCFFEFLSTLVSVVLAIFLAKLVLESTDGFFGLQEKIAGGFERVFSKVNGFNVDISASGIAEALKEKGVSSGIRKLVVKVVGKGELTSGTTVAMLLGETLSVLAATIIVALLLFVGIKLILRFLKVAINGIINKIPLVKTVNSLLGGLFGLLYAVVIVSGILLLLTLLPFQQISTFFSKTIFVGALFENNPLLAFIRWIL